MSIALVLLALIPIFLFTDSYLTVRGSTTDSKNAALLYEKDFYRRADIRNALISEMRQAASRCRGTEESSIRCIAGDLSENMPKTEAVYAADGVNVSFWCGGFSTIDEVQRFVDGLANESGEDRTKKCSNCWFLGEPTAGLCISRSYPPTERIDIVPQACAFLLATDTATGKVSVNKAEWERTSDALENCTYPDVELKMAGKQSVFGASIYDSRTNTSSVVILPQGYGVDYG